MKSKVIDVLVTKSLVLRTNFPVKSDFQTLIQLQLRSAIITIMGNLISTLLFKPTAVVMFYKCPPDLDFDFSVSDQFLLEEDNFVILSTPEAKTITIEESDY